MVILFALKKIEQEKDVEGVIRSLRGNLFAKVTTVGGQLEFPTNQRDKDCIDSFYTAVIENLNQHDGLYDTFTVI